MGSKRLSKHPRMTIQAPIDGATKEGQTMKCKSSECQTDPAEGLEASGLCFPCAEETACLLAAEGMETWSAYYLKKPEPIAKKSPIAPAYEITIRPHDPLNPGHGYRLKIERNGVEMIGEDHGDPWAAMRCAATYLNFTIDGPAL
jgi:hypothetical protein